MTNARRFLAIFLPHLSTDRCARQADDANDPVARATFAPVQGGQQLAAVCPRAAHAGLRPGLALAEARARVPDLRVERHAPEADRALLRRLAEATRRWSPAIALESDNSGLRLDVCGVAHLFGGEDGLLSDVAARFARQRLVARICLADTLGAAWAGARFAFPDIRGKPVAVRFPSGETREAIASLKIAGLNLPAENLATLERLGLRKIGDLYPLADVAGGRAALARRFGPLIARHLMQALGAEAEPLAPDAPPAALRTRLSFAEPISAPADIERAVAWLAGELCAQLEAAALGARRLSLVFHRVDGEATRIALGTSRPSRDAAAFRRLFAGPIQQVDPGFGLELVTLDAELVDGLEATQQCFTRTLMPDGEESFDQAPLIAPLVDRLANRLGAANVTRLAHVESHLPERAQAAIAPLSQLPARLRDARPPAKLRPLRLLAYPEPIDVVAELPDAPPAMFRWRRLSHQVAAAAGPERIAAEWWRRQAEPRDYYRLEDREGRRFWVYREGLWTSERERPPRWYLHGLFA
jgi:protein ImuB